MRVLHVVQELRRGGAETVVQSLVSALTARGWQAEVAAAPGPWSTAFAAVPVHPLPVIAQRPHQLVAGAVALNRALRRARPDVVHCHNPSMALLAALPTWRGRRPPTLVTVHGVDASQYHRAGRVLALSGMQVVACGPGVHAALAAAGSPVHLTILNGIPPAEPALSRADLRRQLGLEPTAVVMASVGRLVPLKRHDLAIRATALLPDVTLLVVGTGPEEASLRELAATLRITHRVILTGLRNDVSAMLGAVDAMFFCSRGEGLPLTLLEALAARTPVIAAAVPGVRETVMNERDALLCEAAPGALAQAAHRLLGDTALARRLTLAGLETVRPYSERRMVEDYLDAYRQLLRGSAS